MESNRRRSGPENDAGSIEGTTGRVRIDSSTRVILRSKNRSLGAISIRMETGAKAASTKSFETSSVKLHDSGNSAKNRPSVSEKRKRRWHPLTTRIGQTQPLLSQLSEPRGEL